MIVLKFFAIEHSQRHLSDRFEYAFLKNQKAYFKTSRGVELLTWVNSLSLNIQDHTRQFSSGFTSAMTLSCNPLSSLQSLPGETF